MDFMDELILLLKEAESERMCDCGRKYNAFTCENAHEHSDTKPFVFSYRLELRICPRCSKARGRIFRMESQKLLKRCDKTPKYRWEIPTLTQKHAPGEELTAGKVKGFNQKARKLINLLYPKKAGCGALSVTEIGANLNIHAHALVYGPYVPQKRISAFF